MSAAEVRIDIVGDEAAGELLTVRRAAFVTEAQLYDDPNIPPLTQTLDELRAVRNPGSGMDVARIAATDPLNLVGILSPGPRVSAVVGNAVLFLDGQAVASVEAGHLVLRAPLPPGARVDEDLTYHPPPRPVQIAPQAALPL